MKSEWNLRLLILVGATTVVSACGPTESRDRDGNMSGFVELMAKDPFRRSFDFRRGTFGAVIQDNEIRNAGSHIEYSSYYAGELSVGIQGNAGGVIVDVGSTKACLPTRGHPNRRLARIRPSRALEWSVRLTGSERGA